MKIEKYTKLRDNRYNVTIDDITFKLYDDVIIKFELLRKKELTSEELDTILEYNSKLEAYYKSLRYIQRKLRTEKEITKYLEKDYSKEVIKETIERLKKDNYLNKEIYLKSYLSDQINLGLNGPAKITKDLIKLGFKEEEIKDSVDNINNDIWYQKLDHIINKRIKTNHTYGSYKLKEKIIYDLGNLGYYRWMIEDIINSYTFYDNIDLIKKEYQKEKNKLSKKYDGSELEYQIRIKLLKKGFSSSNIDKINQ